MVQQRDLVALALLLLAAMAASSRADIYRWDNGQVIPGTEQVTPGPGVILDHHELSYADLTNHDLTDSRFEYSNLTNAQLYQSTLTNANLGGAVVTGADFSRYWNGQRWLGTGLTSAQLESTASYQAKNLQGINLSDNDLTGWDLSGQNLTNAGLYQSTLTDANLSGALVTGGSFSYTTSRGFTQAQLASTASYQAKNLQGIGLGGNDLTAWDLSGQNLANASLYQSALTNANLSGAVVTGADFDDTTSRGFTEAQLRSTVSYQAKNLTGIRLLRNDLTGWDFSGQNLTNASLSMLALSSTLTQANLSGANLTNAQLFSSTLTQANLSGANLTSADLSYSTLTQANLSGAVVTGASFSYTTSRGFTAAQLYSTQSYQAKNLSGIRLWRNDLTGWDFSGHDLTEADFSASNLTNANLAGALVTGSRFGGTFSKEQLYSTASYKVKNLHGIQLGNPEDFHVADSSLDLTGWDFSGQDLTGASFAGSNLKDADLTDAIVAWLNFGDSIWNRDQLYSTASYKAKDLRGVLLVSAGLNGWDFSGQDLTNASLDQVELTGANLTGANLSNTDFANASELQSVVFDDTTIYNQWTRFPSEFNPQTKGLSFRASLPGDFDANDRLDQNDLTLLSTLSRNEWFPHYHSRGYLFPMLNQNDDIWLDEEDVASGSKMYARPGTATLISMASSTARTLSKSSRRASMKLGS